MSSPEGAIPGFAYSWSGRSIVVHFGTLTVVLTAESVLDQSLPCIVLPGSLLNRLIEDLSGELEWMYRGLGGQRDEPSPEWREKRKFGRILRTIQGCANQATWRDISARVLGDAGFREIARSTMLIDLSDFRRVNDRGIQNLLRSVDVDELARSDLARLGLLKDIFFPNMSSRSMAIVVDELRYLADSVTDSEREEANQALISIANRLAEQGDLIVDSAVPA